MESPIFPHVEDCEERGIEILGQHFWARRYFVSTVGRDEDDQGLIREYIRNQQEEDKRLDQMNLWR